MSGGLRVQNCLNSFLKSRNGKLRLFAQRFAIPVINEDRAAAGRVGTINVPPAITNEEALGQVDAMSGGSALEHTGRRLSAIARIAMSRAAVETNFDPIE